MKKFFSLTLTLAAMLSAMAVSAQAADYSFETDGTPEYPPLPMRTSTAPATITVEKMWWTTRSPSWSTGSSAPPKPG
jgi:hypothetical protein